MSNEHRIHQASERFGISARELRVRRKKIQEQIFIRTGIRLTNKELDVYLEMEGKKLRETEVQTFRMQMKEKGKPVVEVVNVDIEKFEGYIPPGTPGVPKEFDELKPGDKFILNGTVVKVQGK